MALRQRSKTVSLTRQLDRQIFIQAFGETHENSVFGATNTSSPLSTLPSNFSTTLSGTLSDTALRSNDFTYSHNGLLNLWTFLEEYIVLTNDRYFSPLGTGHLYKNTTAAEYQDRETRQQL
jgi:hypothetical protein